MKATPAQQANLLDLQQTDLRSSRLKHQISTHPIREKLTELKGRVDDLQRFSIGLATLIEDQQRDLAQLEGEIEKVRTRREVQEERLRSGVVGIRDMSAVEHEIGRIRERQDDLEANLLEQMEAIEDSESKLQGAKAQIVAISSDEAATVRDLEVALSESKAELDQQTAKRDSLIGEIPSDVVEEYERLRGRHGPIVVLRLEDGMLINSPVSVSQEELDEAQAAPTNELWFSDESGYIIARP